jgi:putative transposase
MRDVPFLPKRRSVRLPTFDYSQPSAYFLTICVRENRLLFGRVTEHRVSLSVLGRIVDECWLEIPSHCPGAELSEHIVMPNHVHGIVILRPSATDDTHREKAHALAADGKTLAKDLRRAQHAVPLRLDGKISSDGTHRFGQLVTGSIPTIVRSFKSECTKRIRKHTRKPASLVWQRGYYESVIWDVKQFQETCEYIRLNPAQWEVDRENL